MERLSMSFDTTDSFEDSDELNPRIKIELESLNQAATDVNCLEKEINEARYKYQETFCSCSQELENLRKKFGAKINRARPYYETKELAKDAQSEALLSARKFQSANGVYLAAKETISLAELRLKDDKAACLSPAWQEMLNHALLRVTESEKEKSRSEKEHLEKAAVFSEMEKKLHILEKKHKKSISKAKPYFDAKSELELKLQQIKQSIEDLQQAMQGAKSQYSKSLKNLEAISDNIHETRRQKLILMYPREPGVGAEEDTESHLQELPTLPTSNTDLELSSCQLTDDQSNSDSDDNYDDGKGFNKEQIITNSQKDNDIQESFSNHPENHPVKSYRFMTVKDRPILRKSASMPSYVVEENLPTDIETFQVETETVILKMESGTTKHNPENVKKINSSTIQTIPQILNPSALCYREPVIGSCSGDQL